MARIMCLVGARRDGTVRTTVGKNAYVFTPDGYGNLVCDVDDKDDAATMLSVPERFRRVPSPSEPIRVADDSTSEGADAVESETNAAEVEPEAPKAEVEHRPSSKRGR